MRTDARKVPVKCQMCGYITVVYNDSWIWFCPTCGGTHFDVDKYMVGKDEYYRQERINKVIPLQKVQQQLWGTGHYPHDDKEKEYQKIVFSQLPPKIRPKPRW